jgi:hypothetical protein
MKNRVLSKISVIWKILLSQIYSVICKIVLSKISVIWKIVLSKIYSVIWKSCYPKLVLCEKSCYTKFIVLYEKSCYPKFIVLYDLVWLYEIYDIWKWKSDLKIEWHFWNRWRAIRLWLWLCIVCERFLVL